MSLNILPEHMSGPGYPGLGFKGVPTVKQVNLYMRHHFAGLWRGNGPSSPFKRYYKYIHTKHARRILWEASDAHDAGYWVLRLPGSPFHNVSKKNWDIMYRDYIRANGHPIIAAYQYRTLRIAGYLKAWRPNGKRMQELGYISLSKWQEIKQVKLQQLET